MRLFSWNINGVRAGLRKGALQNFLAAEKPDVLCLQEVKATREQVEFDFQGYRVAWNPARRAGYSGTAVLVKDEVWREYDVKDFSGARQMGKIAEHEGRVLILDFKKFYLVNVYTPNSKRDLSRLKLRELDWDPGFLKLLKELETEKPVVTCGDFNAAHTEIDIARPKANQKNAGFTKEERQGIANLLAAGFVDSFRELNPGVQRYTWWSHMGHARENNVGWRIDYFFVSKILRKQLREAEIYETVMGSDHCPVSVELDI